MFKRATLFCLLLPFAGLCAQQNKPPVNFAPRPAQQSEAEKVFASTASKVVFLITRKSGELYARASGVILTADGYIATNYHALQGADAVEIRFFPNPNDSDNYQSFNGAKLLYADADRDIAVLKVKSNSLPFLECSAGPGCEPRVGETVYAIGNPKGLTNTISEGIVSALRSTAGENVIQHTAAISPGSSGGALVDSHGALLGMNSWQLADAQNLNFAISAEHLLVALAAARHATSALAFPPELPVEADSPTDQTAGRPRNRVAIHAEFVELAASSKRGTINFWFALTNTTDVDYRIDRLDEITTAGWLADDSFYEFNQGITFEVPLIIPAHRRTVAMLHVVLLPSDLSVPDNAPENAVSSYKANVVKFLRSNYAALSGFAILDERCGYEIDFPLPKSL